MPPRPGVQPSAIPPPPLSMRLRPLVFIGTLGVVLVGALLFLLFHDDARPGELTEEEVHALLLADPPASEPLPPLWAEPTRPSDLHLTSDPAGAFVQVNSEWVGSTPLQLDDLRPGFYSVTFRGSEHVPLDTSFYLASGSLLHLDVRLRPSAPLIPDGAPVAERRRAPSPERRRIDRSGRSSGGGNTSERPTFETASPSALQRVAHTGSLSVASNPAGAEVLLDGEPIGQAPLAIGGLRPKAYVVTLSLPGYDPITYRTEVSAQTVSVVKADFPRPGW